MVISGSPEMGLNDQPTLGNVTLAEFREASPVPAAIQVVYPAKQATGQSDEAKNTRVERRRPLLPDCMLVNSYLPPLSPAPPMEELSVPRLEGAQEIIDRGESSAYPLHDLYSVMLQMPVTGRAGGRAKSIPSQSLLVLLKKISSK